MPAWRQVLKDCGYPLTTLGLDFETYFDSDYKMAGKGDGLSTIEYIKDERFEVLGLAVLHNIKEDNFPDYESNSRFIGGRDVRIFLESLQETFGPNLEKCTVFAQNARFDLSILAFRYGIRPKYVIDTLGLARAWNARSTHGLAELAEQWGLPPKGETQDFSGVTFREGRMFKPKGRNKLPEERPVASWEQSQKLAAYAENDVKREWEIFTILLPRLSRPEVELPVMQQTLELYTKPMLQCDFSRGKSIIERMEKELDSVIEPTGLSRADISADSVFEEALANSIVAAGDDPERYRKQTARPIAKANGGGFKRAFAIAKSDPEREILGKHPDTAVRTLMAARGAIDSWPNHISRVNRIMDQSRAMGALGVPLNYHGAATGRDSGAEKTNLQNLGSRGHPLISEIRHLLVAPSGHKLVIVDLSQVEARGLAWLSGQSDLVEKFERNEEIYCGLASKVLGVPVRKPRKDDPPPIAKKYKRWRDLGKVGVLGMGYGMGKDRAFEYANGNPYYCEVDRDTTDKLVDVWRAENQAIVRFWKEWEKGFLYTAKYSRGCEMEHGVRFESREDCDVVMVLPSGRELHYHKVRLERGKFGDTARVWNGREHSWEYVYGGLGVENLCQATCRDILMDSMLELHRQGIRTVHRIHDELVLVTPEDKAEGALKTAIGVMSRRLDWAPGLPLTAEGVIANAYGAH